MGDLGTRQSRIARELPFEEGASSGDRDAVKPIPLEVSAVASCTSRRTPTVLRSSLAAACSIV
jgi:hypothetical protein